MSLSQIKYVIKRGLSGFTAQRTSSAELGVLWTTQRTNDIKISSIGFILMLQTKLKQIYNEFQDSNVIRYCGCCKILQLIFWNAFSREKNYFGQNHIEKSCPSNNVFEEFWIWELNIINKKCDMHSVITQLPFHKIFTIDTIKAHQRSLT